MVTMNTSTELTQRLQNILGCQLEGFPQVYLGLTLSSWKLNLVAINPLIAKVDKHLSGWQGQLLNAKGRSVLVNSILDSSTMYMMAELLFLQGVLNTIDK